MHDVQNLFSSCPSAANASILDIATYGGTRINMHTLYIAYACAALLLIAVSCAVALEDDLERCLTIKTVNNTFLA